MSIPREARLLADLIERFAGSPSLDDAAKRVVIAGIRQTWINYAGNSSLERVDRANAALCLLRDGVPRDLIAKRLVIAFGVSERTARRDVGEALERLRPKLHNGHNGPFFVRTDEQTTTIAAEFVADYEGAVQ